MSTSTEDLDRSLQGLREGFQADGANLEVVGVEEERATIRLIGNDDTCWECIVPPDVLRQVVTSTLKQSCPSLRDVQIEDPRGESPE